MDHPKTPPIDMAKVIARANKAAPSGLQPDMSRVAIAARQYGGKSHVPKPRVSHADLMPEDAGRRSYSTRAIIPLRSCCGFHHGDFQP